jgi:polar amino acid transport system substrate-binding protein
VSFSPKKDDAKALAAKLTAGIRELRASGELARILAKYGTTDWAK